VSILVILGVSMLGGLWVPSFILPGWARDVSMLLPTTWAMRGLDAVTWQGASWRTVLPYTIAIVAFALAGFALAAARLVAVDRAKRRGFA
jgi:ABC-2 type transport system permease protein